MRSFFAIVWFAFASIFITTSAQAQNTFDPVAFGELATRAEQVIEAGQASSTALERLRGTLSDARSSALEAQSEPSNRVKSIRDPIAIFGGG